MARLPYIEPEEADPVTKQVYDDAEARFPSTVTDALNRYSFGWQFDEDGHAVPGDGAAACGA